MTDNGNYNALIESYLPAASAASFTRSDVELAIIHACRLDEQCESCRYSRAPFDAETVAVEEGRLKIYRRSCSLRRLTGNGCSHWEQLEVPEMEEVVA